MDNESNDSISLGEVEDIVKNEPMYFVLSQFLETPEGNVATILQDIAKQLAKLNDTLAQLTASKVTTETSPS